MTRKTLWAATVTSIGSATPPVTDRLQSDFLEQLESSQSDIKKKIEAFENTPLSDAAVYAIIRRLLESKV